MISKLENLLNCSVTDFYLLLLTGNDPGLLIDNWVCPQYGFLKEAQHCQDPSDAPAALYHIAWNIKYETVTEDSFVITVVNIMLRSV